MKKSVLLIAAVGLILAGCSENVVVENQAEQAAIEFRTLHDRVTRAANDQASNYGVYATTSTGTSWFMNNLQVLGNSDTYSPVRYWPTSGATVSFFAYAPQNSANALITSTTLGALPVVYTVPATADEDFTIAAPLTGKQQGDGIMALAFRHMLSKVSVRAVLNQDLLDAGFMMVTTDASVDMAVSRNSASTSLVDPTPFFSNLGIEDFVTYNKANTYPGGVTVPPTFIVMPQQTIVGATSKISFVMKGLKIYASSGDLFFPKSVDIVNFQTYSILGSDIPGDAFEAGKHYTITFTISASSKDSEGQPLFNEGAIIAFSSTVADWTAVPVGLNQN